MSKVLNVLWAISGVLVIAAGVSFIFNPLTGFVITEYIVGGVLILIGLISVFAYMGVHKELFGAGWILAEGLISIIFGSLICFSQFGNLLYSFTIAMALGIWLMFSGISQISRSLELHKLSAKGWGVPMFFGIICLIASISFFFNPVVSVVGATSYLFAIVMTIAGISIISRCFVKDIER